MTQEKLELSDEVYEALVAEYRKVVVIGVDEDLYVVRYPNKIEWKALKKYAEDMRKGGTTGDRAEGLAQETIKGLIVWPEAEVFTEREEYDGGLMTAISGNFLNAYAGRAEEKKR